MDNVFLIFYIFISFFKSWIIKPIILVKHIQVIINFFNNILILQIVFFDLYGHRITNDDDDFESYCLSKN